MTFHKYFAAFMMVVSTPFVAFAAHDDVTFGVGTTLSVGGYNYLVYSSPALIRSIAVDATTFDLSMEPGSSFALTSADLKNFSVTTASGVASSVVCGVSNSTLIISSSATATVTVSPSGTCSSGSGGGGGGSGGGGGGGSVSTSQPTASTTVTTSGVTASSTTFASTTEVVIVGPQLSKNLQLGSTDPEVILLQQFLIDRGLLILPPTVPLGYYGSLTVQAVSNFQTSVGLEPVGSVGPKTRDAIRASIITKVLSSNLPTGFLFTRSLKIGMSGADVAALQQVLIAKGFLVFNGKSTPGYFGGLTKSAVIALQKSVGLEPVGSVGPQTRKTLNRITGAQ